jgi:protein-L-isoaspartate(D-aspartate) O-methyltransferase
VSSLDERAAPFRLNMVETLKGMGVSDQVVLDAMASVPRHRYVDRFWGAPAGMPWTSEHVREFLVDEDVDDETLRVIYEPSTALATRGPVDVPRATSSLSAPIIVALMLAELHLRPGLRVLEIGAGSGYHAALMATLVGDPELVTTLDIDQLLINDTSHRMDRLGFHAMTIRCVDGALGASDRAPFDRIVATVGCADLSPAWIEQLAPDGALLVPLEHGQVHPRVQVQSAPELRGRFVGHSGFIPIRGLQDTARLWQSPRALSESRTDEDLPEVLLEVFPRGVSESRQKRVGRDFETYLALRDRRACGAGLVEDDSGVMLINGRLVVAGAQGSSLKAIMLRIAADWRELGSPGLNRYLMKFRPRSAPDHNSSSGDSPVGPWHIARLDHDQTTWIIPP